MFQKKRFPAMLMAAFLLAAAGPATAPEMNIHAKSSVSFYAGDAAVEEFEGRKPVKISSAKVPEGCSIAFFTSDKQQINGTVTSADTKKATVTKLHQGAGWYVNGKTAGKTTLNYKQGSKNGTIAVQVLPKLKLKAVKKSAKVSAGNVKLTLKYKNESHSDIIIEGVDTGMAQILFQGDKAPAKEAVVPSRWTAKKVTIPAGKTKTFSVTHPAGKSGKIQSFQYPALYFQYQGAYFSSSPNRSGVKGYLSYHGTMSFQEFAK